MSDDLREREPRRQDGDDPTIEGTRSDGAGTGSGVTGPAPAGGEPDQVIHDDRERDDPERVASSPAGDSEAPGGALSPAGGGYGSASDRPSSGGSGDGTQNAGVEDSTRWLRDAPGGAADPSGGG